MIALIVDVAVEQLFSLHDMYRTQVSRLAACPEKSGSGKVVGRRLPYVFI